MTKRRIDAVVACGVCGQPMARSRRLLPTESADPVADALNYDPGAGHATTAGAVGSVRPTMWKWRCPSGHEINVPES